MIRNRIKQRVQERRDKRAATAKKEESSQTEAIATGQVDSETEFNVINANNVGHDDVDDLNDIDEDEFDYLTDICKEKKFNKKELSIIIKVLRLELQPLIYLALFTKGIVIWENNALSLLFMLTLLYFAYIDVVKYLFGACFVAMCALMYCMKLNPDRTVFVLALFVGLVTPIEETDQDLATQNTVESTEKELRRWQIIARAKKVKQKIQEKILFIGGFQYNLYELSIYIGKLRAVFFYQHEPTSKILCCTYGVIGLFCMVLPARINFAISLFALFAATPLLAVLRKRKTAKQREETRKKLVTQLKSIEPDIPVEAFAYYGDN